MNRNGPNRIVKLPFSSNLVAYNATIPPPAPITTDPKGEIQFALAVTATNPANTPLIKSPAGAVSPCKTQYSKQATIPAAAARNVFSRILGTSSSSTRLLPPLKPCHPKPSSKTPKTDKGKLLGENFLVSPSTNLPLLGPIINMIASPIHP